MPFTDKVTTGTYKFVSLIVKIILLELKLLSLSPWYSLPSADKTQYFAHLIFNFTLQLINAISSDLQKLFKYFNGTATVAIFRIPLAAFGAGLATVFSNNSVLYLKDLKLLLAVSALKSVVSSLEKKP